ncbi:MAG: phosphate ABC transporter permease PstA [Hyalangium sp.]|uniref:phosphate ABC transporter permease PstA n=1 Tax=Hyalangium sp. TaxID=2028555 RepID=UPI00389AE2E1
MRESRARGADRLATLVFWAGACLVAALFLWLVGDVLWRGFSHLSLSFLTDAPEDAGRTGGIAPIIVSTLIIVAICMAVTVPLGLGTAILLAEYLPGSSRQGRLVRRSLDVLAGVPSVVFGLFGNALFCQLFGLGFSLLSGGLTLACMVLPFFIRTAEEGLRAVPREYRMAASALGLSQTGTLAHVLLPAAMPGLMAGFILAVTRSLAETAALIFTSGYVDRMPESLFESGRTLSVHIYDLAMNVSGGDGAAYASALVLMVILIVLNRVAMWLSRKWSTTKVVAS